MTKALPAMLVVVALAGVAPGRSAPPSDLRSLAWMAGCWRLEQGAVRIDEWWMAPAGGLMLGIARTLRDGLAVEHEFLLLRAEEEGIIFTASPSGQATTSFRLVYQDVGEVVFANPAHDFPQRISYRKLADGGIAARVEGVVGGKPKSLDFSYKSVRCGWTPESEH